MFRDREELFPGNTSFSTSSKSSLSTDIIYSVTLGRVAEDDGCSVRVMIVLLKHAM